VSGPSADPDLGVPHAVIDRVEALHADIDAAAAPLARAHATRLQCAAGCAGCCTDELTVFAVEAAVIRRHHADVLDQQPGPPGACALLDPEGRCRVYAHRPYVCRTQGLPLRWDTGDAAAPEGRDICPLNAPGPALDALDPDDCWTLGPIEARLRDLQESIDGGAGDRVALRSLFGASPPPPEDPNTSLRDALRGLFGDG